MDGFTKTYENIVADKDSLTYDFVDAHKQAVENFKKGFDGFEIQKDLVSQDYEKSMADL